jgi:hypothetical protein
VLLVVLGVLGVLVTALLLAAGVRVELAPSTLAPAKGSRATTRLGVAGLAVTLLVLAFFLILARSWVAGLATPLPDSISFPESVRIVAATWIPPLVAVPAQLAVAALAGLGIGVLRPLGRRSEWLLLIFAPGLFINPLLLLTGRLPTAISDGRSAESDLPIPVLVGIPAIYIFTFVLAGLRRAWDADPRSRSWTFVTGASTVGLTFVVSWVVQAQTLTWANSVAVGPGPGNGQLTLYRLSNEFVDLPQQLATPVPLMVLLAAVAAAAMIGMDRLRLGVGRSEAASS